MTGICLCKGQLKTITTVVNYRGRTFENVPALQCPKCKEIYVAEEAYILLDQILDTDNEIGCAIMK